MSVVETAAAVAAAPLLRLLLRLQASDEVAPLGRFLLAAPELVGSMLFADEKRIRCCLPLVFPGTPS